MKTVLLGKRRDLNAKFRFVAISSILLGVTAYPDLFAEQIMSLAGTVKTQDGQAVPNAFIELTGRPKVKTSAGGRFSIPLEPALEAGDPVILSVGGWVAVAPYSGESGRTFLSPGAQVAVVVAPRGELRLAENSALLQNLLEEFCSRLAKDSPLEQFLAEKSRQFGLSKEQLKSALDAWIPSPSDHYQNALSAIYNGEYGKAKEHLDAASRSAGRRGAKEYQARAKVEFQMGRLKLARTALSRSLKIQPKDPLVLQNLGFLLLEESKFEQAKEPFDHAFAIVARTSGRLAAAPILERWAVAFHSHGRYEEARPLYERALSIRKESSGPEGLGYASTLNNLAALYRQLAVSPQDFQPCPAQSDSLYCRSEMSYRRALEIKRKILGVKNPSLARTLNNLALLYQYQNRIPEAINTYKESVSILSGIQHPETASVLRSLANLERDQRNDREAEKLYLQARQALAPQPDNPPLELGLILSDQAQLLRLQGKEAEAAALEKQAGEILEKAAGQQAGTRPVTETTSMVSLSDWTLRFNFDSGLIQQLPLRGFRTFDQLSLLSPGVFRVPFVPGRGPAVGLGVGTPGQFAVNGFRGRSNNFVVDGSDNNDEDIGMRRRGFVSLIPQTVDSIESFQIQTLGFQSEFGRAAGSIVNAVSRSGTAEVHGSAYGLFNDDWLNSRGFFDHKFEDTNPENKGRLNGGSFPAKDFRQTQVGGVIGGMFVPDSLFYFFSGEYRKQGGSSLGHFVVPSAGERGLRSLSAGNARGCETDPDFVPIGQLQCFFNLFSPRFPSSRNAPAGGNFSAAAGEGVFSLYPLPNHPTGPFGDHTFSQAMPNRGSGIIFSGKVDWEASDDSTFTARYNLTDDDSVIPFTADALNSSVATDTRTQNISTYLNTAKLSFANTLRVSYGRTRLDFPPEKGSELLFGSQPFPGLPDEEIVTSFGRFGPFGATGPIGQLTIVPYSTIGVDVFNFPQGRVDNTFQLADTFVWMFPAHDLQIGFDFRFSQLNSFSDRNSRPAYFFGHGIIADCFDGGSGCPFETRDGLLSGTDLAALGAPAGVLQTLSTQPFPDTAIALRFNRYEFFVQDNWRLSPNLTINLGLRFETQTVPREQDRRIEDTFNLSLSQFGRLNPDDFSDQADKGIIEAANKAFELALQGWDGFLNGRQAIYDPDRNNWAPRVGFAWDPLGTGKTAIRAGYGIFYDANLGAVTSQSRNVFPTFVPLNLDPNFNPPTGAFLNSLIFLQFLPCAGQDGAIVPPSCGSTTGRIIEPGTLNSYGLSGDAFATGLGTLLGQQVPFPETLGALSSNGVAFTLPERQFRTSYGQHWTLTLQRQFGDYMASLSYAGTRGIGLTRFTTPNRGLISTPALFWDNRTLTILDLPPGTRPNDLGEPRFGRPETNLGAYSVFQNHAQSDYHSLQASVLKRLAKGMQFRANWTWSHTIDQISDPFLGRGFFALPQDATRPDLERGAANFDVRHRLSGLFFYQFPTAWLKGALAGWAVTALGEFQTGQPFTVNTSFDRNLDGNLTDRLNSMEGLESHPGEAVSILRDPSLDDPLRHLAPLGENGRIARNSFRADDLLLLDLGVTKRFSLKDGKAKLDLRLEAFNLLNNTSFGIPVRVLESPAFGRSFDTQTPARSLRLGLKLSF